MADQVLITGVTGHIGSTVLVKALQEGYAVRAAVRSMSSKDKILNAPAIAQLDLRERLSFVEVPDILDPTAYNDAVVGMDYVIHLASPLISPHFAGTDLQQTVINPAVQGTTNILNAALASKSVKRVVITSSIVANTDIGNPSLRADPSTRASIPEFSDPRTAYRASKHAALLASDQFMANHEPHFDLINVMPSFVVGRKELATSAADVLAGSNGLVFSLVLQGPQNYSAAGSTCHIDDVALVHVTALKLPGKENRSFGVETDANLNHIPAILKKHFPGAFKKGLFKEPPSEQRLHYLQWDAHETEKVFGIKFKGLEEQVVSVAQQVLELEDQA